MFSVAVPTATVEQAQDSVGKTGIPGDEVIVTEVTPTTIRIQTPSLESGPGDRDPSDLSKTFDVAPNQISAQVVGPSWGDQITKKAVRGLVIFLVLVAIFLSVYFEWKMAVAALVALVHDLVITVGIYALTGFDGHAGDRDRRADDPRLLALRHRRGLRQGQGERPRYHVRQPR